MGDPAQIVSYNDSDHHHMRLPLLRNFMSPLYFASDFRLSCLTRRTLHQEIQWPFLLPASTPTASPNC